MNLTFFEPNQVETPLALPGMAGVCYPLRLHVRVHQSRIPITPVATKPLHKRYASIQPMYARIAKQPIARETRTIRESYDYANSSYAAARAQDPNSRGRTCTVNESPR